MKIPKKKLATYFFAIVVVCTVLYIVNQPKLVFGSDDYETVTHISFILENNNITYNVKKELNENKMDQYEIYVSPSKYSSATELIVGYLKSKN